MTKIAGSGSISQRHGSADPDPDTDPPQNVRNTGQNSKVKEQTFHNRSINVPTWSDRKWNQNVWVCSQICPHRKSTYRIYLIQESRFSGPNQNNLCLYKTNSGTIAKRFGFVFKTISESFWHYYWPAAGAGAASVPAWRYLVEWRRQEWQKQKCKKKMFKNSLTRDFRL